jgi:hypothetical protein
VIPNSTQRPAGGDLPETSWYMYAVTSDHGAARVSPAKGINAAPVEFVRSSGLVALVSPLPVEAAEAIRSGASSGGGEGAGTAREAIAGAVKAHAAVVDSIFSSSEVVPFRFGTLWRSTSDVAEFLDRDKEDLETALDQVRGRSEWDVKVSWDRRLAGRALGWAQEDNSGDGARIGRLESPGSGRAYLLGKKRELDLAQHIQLAKESLQRCLHSRIEHNAIQSTVFGAGAGPDETGRETVLHAAYLVENEARTDFEGEIQSQLVFGGELDLRGELTGPWPPYTFCDLKIEAMS